MYSMPLFPGPFPQHLDIFPVPARLFFKNWLFTELLIYLAEQNNPKKTGVKVKWQAKPLD